MRPLHVKKKSADSGSLKPGDYLSDAERREIAKEVSNHLKDATKKHFPSNQSS